MNSPALPPGGNQLAVRRNRQLVPAQSFITEEQAEPAGPALMPLWRILWERRWLVLVPAVAGLLTALAWSLLATPLYRSTASLELNPPTIPEPTAGEGEAQPFGAAPGKDQEFLATQLGLLESKALARSAIENLDLAPRASEAAVNDLAGQLLSRVDVDPRPSSRLVDLSYAAENPEDAAKIVNGLANAFVTLSLERRFEATASARRFLETRLADVLKELDQSERKLVDYAQANGIINTGSSGDSGSDVDSLQGASLVALNTMLAEAQQRRIAAEQRYRNMSGSGSAAEVSQRTANLREEKARLEAEYSDKSTFLKDDFPEMVRLRSRITSIEQAIANEAGNVSGSRETTMQSEYQAAVQEERELQGRVNQLKGAVLNLREKSIEYNKLERDLDTNRSLYNSLLERYNQIGVSSGSDAPAASLLDAGDVPASPSTPNYPFNLLLGVLAGLALGTIAALVMHWVMDRITTPDDVRTKLRLAPLGVIPQKKKAEDLVTMVEDRRSAISEAYASLVTTLQFTTGDGIPQVLLVTSSVAAEGKSTTSLVIARLLAQHGRRVLLFDADLRKPSFIVEERADIGFSRLVLEPETGLLRHVLTTNEENLCLLPSGPPPPNPVQLLSSAQAHRTLAEAREFFDVVIIDAPPTYGMADAPLLAAMSDAVLLVVESGKTRRRLVVDAIARLRSSGTTLLGVALTKYRQDAGDYGYKYYAGYGDTARLEAHELSAGLLKRPDDQGSQAGS